MTHRNLILYKQTCIHLYSSHTQYAVTTHLIGQAGDDTVLAATSGCVVPWVFGEGKKCPDSAQRDPGTPPVWVGLSVRQIA